MDRQGSKKTKSNPLIADLYEQDGATREHARQQLVALGSRVTPTLVPLLHENDRQTRWEAAMALKEIADPASISALLGALEDDDPDVCWVAAEGLAAIGRPAVVALLRVLLDGDESAKLRQGAHHVLREVRGADVGDSTQRVYEALSGMNADVGVAVEAERALKDLGPGLPGLD